MILFLSHQQQTLENERSISCNSQCIEQIQSEQQSVVERETRAAQIIQVKDLI